MYNIQGEIKKTAAAFSTQALNNIPEKPPETIKIFISS